MSTDSMPILPETDPASDRWAIQDSNGGKCLQDMGSEVVFESIRISKCLLNESTDRRCGDKPALKMKIVLADKKDKSEISPNPVRTHEEDEDTDIIEDESDSSSELTIVDDTKTDKPPSDQEQMKRKSPKEGRRKRKAREAQDPKSHAVKKRREEREAEKRRAEEIFKTQENEAMAKRIQMEFSNLRRFRTPATPDSSSKTGSNPPPDPVAQKREVSSKLPSRESSPQADPMPPKSSTENSAALARSLESVSVVIPSNENLRLMARNGSVSSSTPQSDASCSDKLGSDRKDSFLVSSTPSPGKHHIPIGLLPAPTTLHSALGSSHQSTGGAKRESPRQSPRNSPDTSPRVLPDQMNPKVTIDLARSPEPSQTMVSNASHCPGPPPPTIHIPGPLCLTDQHTPKLRETPSESHSEAAGQNRGSPKVHVSSQSESSIATRTSPPSFYSTPPPLSVEVPLIAGYQPSSNRGQPHAVPHSRSRTQNQFGNPASNTDTIRALEGQTKFKTSTATDVDKLSNAVFNPKFSAFSVDNLTKIDIRGRDKSRSSPSDLTKESPRTTQASYEVTSPSGALKEKQTTPRVVEDPNSSTEKVRVVRQSEFEFARPQAAPRKSRMKTSSPPPLSSSGSAPPFCAAATPGNINGQNSESKSALIWRYIQDQSGTNTMQTIDSALESVRASSNCLKQDDSSTILANYLQGQRKEESSDDVARERPVSPDPVLQSRDPRSLYLTKLKKMLVTLQKFSTTISMEVGKAVYHNIYALASGANNVEEFIAKTQRATKLALKPYVGPFLASYLPLLQKEITVKAASVRMSSSRYMRSNPECLIDPVVEPGDPHEVFVSEFDIPNKKKSLPQPPPPTPNMLAAHIPVQDATTDHLANSRLSLEMHDSDPRYQTHLTIQNDLLLIQEMLDRISKMVESTKRTLSTLQEESSASGCRDTSAQSSPCCSPVVSAHVSPPSCALSPKDLATSLGRLETYSKSPPRYTSNAQNFSSCNAQQKNSTYLQSAIMASRPATSELSRASLMNCGNRTQKDSIMRLEMRNQQVTHSMPPAASPSYSMRPSSEHGSSSMHKDAALNSSPNPPMPVASMSYGPPDVLVSRSELLQKELGASNHRESIPVLSSSTMQSYPATNAADKKYQESLQLKSSTTNVISKNPVNLSSPQRLISQPANIGDPECCWNCGRSAQETCSGCKLAKYCGLFCQHRDWEIHHRVCRLIGTNSPRSPNQH